MPITELLPEKFPAKLLEIPDPPEKLWMRGSFPPLGTKLLTVVGSRALTRYGRDACEMLLGGLAGYPISIVSGLALGADACAHRAALAAGLHTIAIPGSGLDDRAIGPMTNLGLAHEILEAGGALISENEPRHRARSYDFPSRNRIMVGLADAILIIEAGAKSGTLITSRLASEYNRELLYVPHRIGDPHGFGAHLFSRLGATAVIEPSHILEALQIPAREESATRPLPVLTSDELLIYNLLEEPCSRDDIIRAAALPPRVTLTTLISLELKSVAKEEFGLWRHA
jgi:DNA processing protein